MQLDNFDQYEGIKFSYCMWFTVSTGMYTEIRLRHLPLKGLHECHITSTSKKRLHSSGLCWSFVNCCQRPSTQNAWRICKSGIRICFRLSQLHSMIISYTKRHVLHLRRLKYIKRQPVFKITGRTLKQKISYYISE